MILLIAPLAHAQDDRITREALRDFTNSEQGGVLRTRSVTEYRGTPFFNEWSKGHVIINNNRITEPIPLRYDMEYDAVQFTRDGNIYAITNDKMEGFVIYTSDGNIEFRNGFNTDKDDITPNTLLRVVYDGKDVKLVAHHTSTLHENMPTYGSATKTSEFVNDTNFFLIKNGTFHQVKLREKDILNVLEDQREALKSYAEENNLDYDEEVELKKILAQYDHLTSAENSQ